MKIWLITGIIVIAATIISLFFEDGRDWWADTFDYIIGFEWWDDLIDFFGGLFDDLGEFSIGGLVFGISSFGLTYLLRYKMLTPFTLHMGHFEAIFWSGVTYIGVFILGYLVGKRIFDDE